MPILPPSLDDRRFDDLVEDLIARIPAHTPEWTNPRLGDPGRTLIELFAWLGDTLLYRANLIPGAAAAGVPLAARARLKPARAGHRHRQPRLTRSRPSAARSTLRPGARVNGPVPFETLGETTVLPISGQAYIKRALSEAEAHAGRRADRRPRRASTGSAARPRATRRCRCSTAGGRMPTASTSSRRAPTTRCGSRCSRREAPRPDQQPAVNDAGACRARRRRYRRAGAHLGWRGAGAEDAGGVRGGAAADAGAGACGRSPHAGATPFETDYLTLEPLARRRRHATA